MPTYIGLLKLTDQGLRNFKDILIENQRRRAEGDGDIERSGGRFIGAWMTHGAYDAVVVAEFPDDESGVSKITTSMLGNWRGEQMRAFTMDEMQELVQRLP